MKKAKASEIQRLNKKAKAAKALQEKYAPSTHS
jgi:hypothetical protein